MTSDLESRETSHHGPHCGPHCRQLPTVWHPLSLRRCGWRFAVNWLSWLPFWYFVLQFVSKCAATSNTQHTRFQEPAFSRPSRSHTISWSLSSFTATIRKISAKKSVGSLPLLPYSSMVASAFTWGSYGILKGESNIWSSNGIGLLLGAY